MPHPLDRCPSIAHAFFVRAQTEPNGEVYSQAVIANPDNPYVKRSSRTVNHIESAAHVESIAGYLQSIGFGRGAKAAIFSNTRPEWMEADIAILAAGGISVSVYHSLTAEEAGYIFFDSEAEIVFVENEEQLKKVLLLTETGAAIPATEDRPASHATFKFKKIISFEPTFEHPLAISLEEARRTKAPFSDISMRNLNRNDISALVYTSGTTGPPKGVIQTHGNHLSNVRQVLESGLVGEGMAIMLFLPLAHSFAKLMGYLGFLATPTLCFPAITDHKSSKHNMDSVTRDIRESKADIVPIVPRIVEKMEAGVRENTKHGTLKSKLLNLTIETSKLAYESQGKLPLLKHLIHEGTSGVRQQLKQALFGENFKYAVSGGAKLDPSVNRFFDSLGVEILEGYGLTETCVATNVNRVGLKRIGTVGKVLTNDIELKIAEDGEILFRGPNVTPGYYKRPTATKSSWDSDGWFHTGDLGSVDTEGYLSIVGRKKEIIVTSYGKKISPDFVESALRASPYISQAIIFGDDKPYCVAVITINLDALEHWANEQGLALNDSFNLHPQVLSLINGEVANANSNLASYETIKRFFVAPTEFSTDNGLLTPTLKVKRAAVFERYRDEILALFQA